jgi:hypothetical protein
MIIVDMKEGSKAVCVCARKIGRDGANYEDCY